MKDELNDNINFKQLFIIGAVVSLATGLLILTVFIAKLNNQYGIPGIGQSPDLDVSSKVGTFIGGVIGIFFSLAGVFLLILTFAEQRNAFKKERFEARFFELLKFHRDNVAEFEIAGTVKGRHCFKYMINELRFIYRIVEVGALRNNVLNAKPKVSTKKDYLRMAYLIMFFGIGYSSERQLMEIFNEEEAEIFEGFVKEYLEIIQEEYEEKSPNFQSAYFTSPLPIEGIPDGFTFETLFYPFDGHTSRLGHYFRHLFQTVKFVDSQPLSVITQSEKYEYLKHLRGSLSNQEQLLFYYNSISSLGNEWIETGLIKRYALIKNIPLGIVDIGIHPHDVYGKFTEDGKYLFETDEISSKKNS